MNETDALAVTQADAPGGPGIQPRWTSSDKTGVGTALSPFSRVWFTISHGILNEVYYPRLDQACIRDFGLLVTDGAEGGFFSEEKRDTATEIQDFEDGVPAYRVVNTCRDGRYRIEKCIVSDPCHDAVLQQIVFVPSAGPTGADAGSGLKLFGLLAPHLVNGGADNTAWLGDYKGMPMLFAEGDGTSLALACSVPWRARSAGFVGASDGWQELSRHGRLANRYERAVNGNVALTGEIDFSAGEPVVLALAFGRGWGEAAFHARAALMRPFATVRDSYVADWRSWQSGLRDLRGHSTNRNTYRISTAVLRAHDSAGFPGGIIASLSIPWGASQGDDDLGGYHLVWPRDLVETAGGLLACGAHADARRVLEYLRTTQEADGHWPQNCWLDGTAFWGGVQMDECAFPILLIDLAARNGALPAADIPAFWPMARKAAGFLLRNGPVTGQDRWEEDAGYSTFTLAVEVSALLAAADLADAAGEAALGVLLRETADAWNDAIEDWTFARGTELARAAGVDGYYLRIAPPVAGTADAATHGTMTIRNRPSDAAEVAADRVVSPDALALVRFGLRAADDPRILATLKVIDHVVRVELPAGPCWYRYNMDGYGEHEDGRPFDGSGIGRLWPLLTGERAHYELAAGRPDEARRLLAALEAFSSSGHLIPEQIWDQADIPALQLFRGHPSGSAMPLVWAHAEHIKLCRSLADGAVFDMPPRPARRYVVDRTAPRVTPWRPDWQATRLRAGRALRLDLPHATTVSWSADGWATSVQARTTEYFSGLHCAEIASEGLAAGRKLLFRFGGPEHGIDVVA
jgi:glucoamylase